VRRRGEMSGGCGGEKESVNNMLIIKT